MAAHMKKTGWDNIPEWAIYALEYGTEEDGIQRHADSTLYCSIIYILIPVLVQHMTKTHDNSITRIH